MKKDKKNNLNQEDLFNTEENKVSSSNGNGNSVEDTHLSNKIPVDGMFENWFLDYASYVILDRAVPALNDGLKPVQRRLMHTLYEMDDGRFHKCANVIGQTMKYHPHGDAAIGEALVNLGQKGFLIDTQGNWGDPVTGDSAAAPRYIEARLSKFALDVLFNPDITHWTSSYDGRNREPITLPVKFPMLLLFGIEGIAVGLATKIMPHNFCELVQASIDCLKKKKIDLYPDFPTGGFADVEKYNEGKRDSRIRIRAKIEIKDKKTLVIKEIPFTTNTEGLIDSIVQANEKGKIKIRKVDDNTAKNVEILIHLTPGTSPDITMDALYAFTGCEVSVSPNSCVIEDGKPAFLSVNDILIKSTHATVEILKQELELSKSRMAEKWHFSSLEKIFIEKRIYRNIEDCETYDAVIETIGNGLKPYRKLLKRDVTKEDILKLMEIKIKRISRFDSFKADEEMKTLEEEMQKVEYHLEHLTQYAIKYFTDILTKYGKGRERKTEIRNFETVSAAEVAADSCKLYVNRIDGFIGTSLKKDEFVCDCSDIDDIIVFRKDGKMQVTKTAEKTFVGKDILHVKVFKKNDDRTIYNMIYQDGPAGRAYIKRFAVEGVIRDKEYDLTKGTEGSVVHYLTENPNGESEVVTVSLKHELHMKKPVFDFDFSLIDIKGKNSMGNILTRYRVRKVVQKSKGISTLGGREIWYDETLMRLNSDGRGKQLGSFSGEDKILAVTQAGTWELKTYDLSTHFEEGTLIVRKFEQGIILSAIHYHGEQKDYFVKRFEVEETSFGRKVSFIDESPGSRLCVVSDQEDSWAEVIFQKGKRGTPESKQILLSEIIDVKGYKANGNKIANSPVAAIKLVSVLVGDNTNQMQTSPTLKGNENPKPGKKEIPFIVVDTRKGKLKGIEYKGE